MPLSSQMIERARQCLNSKVVRGGREGELYGVEFEVEGSGVGLENLFKKMSKKKKEADEIVYDPENDPIPPVLLQAAGGSERVARIIMRDRIAAGVTYDGTRFINEPRRKDNNNFNEWTKHQDGSLRGESCEWVLSEPLDYDKTVTAIEGLFKGFEENGTTFKNSYRTSTHIHVNYQDKTNKQVFNLFVVHAILEKLLGRYCGEDRDGNLFSIYARDSERMVSTMYDALFYEGTIRGAYGDNQRYAALNLSSLAKFGSIEFRLMGGLDNAKEALIWLSMVRELVAFADKLDDATSLFEDLSFNGPEQFVASIFSKDNAERLLGCMPSQELSDSFYEGLRAIQPLAYNVSEVLRFQPKDEWGPVLDIPAAPRPAGINFRLRPVLDEPEDNDFEAELDEMMQEFHDDDEDED